jgi:hypothetical protein
MRTLLLQSDFLGSFKNKDAIVVATQIKNGSEEQKQCAMLLALGLSSEFFKVFSQYPPFIAAVLDVRDSELRYRFLVKLCRFPQACEYLLSVPKTIQKTFKTPWGLTALSRIAGTYPGSVLKLSFFRKKLLRNLQKGIQLEPSLRLLGVFSTTQSLWQDGAFVNILFRILDENQATPLEARLLLAILSNVAGFVSLKDRFLKVLALAEAGGQLGGVALRILAQTELPSKEIKQIKRVLGVVVRAVANGDEYAVAAASRIVENLSLHRELRVVMIDQLKLDKTIVESAIRQTDPYVFIALMSALDKLEVVITSQVLSLFDQMVMKTGASLQAAPEFVRLRGGLRTKLSEIS